MLRILGLIACLPMLIAGCSQQSPSNAAAAPPFQAVTDVHETMLWILDPAADVIWGSAGTIITASETRELAPTTEQGWEAVIQAAAVVTEGGNLLMMPGRSMGEDWNEYSLGLVAAGQLAIKAGLDQNADALFDAGGRIYQVCRACHNQYMIEEED